MRLLCYSGEGASNVLLSPVWLGGATPYILELASLQYQHGTNPAPCYQKPVGQFITAAAGERRNVSP